MEYIQSQMDIDSYFDYVCFQLLAGNRDLSNTKFYRIPGGKWKWILYDLDKGLWTAGASEAFRIYTLDIDAETECCVDHVPFAALMKVPDMRDKFLTRLGELLRQNFSAEILLAGIDEWHDTVAPLIPYQCERWNKMTVGEWESIIRQLKRIAQSRPAEIVELAVQYFHLTEEETVRYFGEL